MNLQLPPTRRIAASLLAAAALSSTLYAQGTGNQACDGPVHYDEYADAVGSLVTDAWAGVGCPFPDSQPPGDGNATHDGGIDSLQYQLLAGSCGGSGHPVFPFSRSITVANGQENATGETSGQAWSWIDTTSNGITSNVGIVGSGRAWQAIDCTPPYPPPGPCAYSGFLADLDGVSHSVPFVVDEFVTYDMQLNFNLSETFSTSVAGAAGYSLEGRAVILLEDVTNGSLVNYLLDFDDENAYRVQETRGTLAPGEYKLTTIFIVEQSLATGLECDGNSLGWQTQTVSGDFDHQCVGSIMFAPTSGTGNGG